MIAEALTGSGVKTVGVPSVIGKGGLVIDKKGCVFPAPVIKKCGPDEDVVDGFPGPLKGVGARPGGVKPGTVKNSGICGPGGGRGGDVRGGSSCCGAGCGGGRGSDVRGGSSCCGRGHGRGWSGRVRKVGGEPVSLMKALG